MRGNICIELHNHKTGLRDRIEGHNDVTDALQTMINACVYSGALQTSYTPVISTLLGGVILMDKELTGGDIFIPSDAKIIGSGFQGSNSSSSIVGTYNSAESGIDDTQRVYTHVWDFATSQANGTIKSLGLTTSLGGQYANSCNTYTRENILGNKYILYVDETNNDVYYVTAASSTAHVYKYHCNFTDLMLHCTSNEFNGVDTGKIVNSLSMSSFASVDGKDGKIYLPYQISSGMAKFRVYNVADLSFQQMNDITITFKQELVPTTSLSGKGMAINGALGYVYVITNSLDYIYRYDMNTNEITIYDISTISPSSANNVSFLSMYAGDLYCHLDTSNQDVSIRINADGYISDGTIIEKPNIFNNGMSISNNGILTSRSEYGILANMLMTNFNLPTPIEKTTASSMKVIYTLTQE